MCLAYVLAILIPVSYTPKTVHCEKREEAKEKKNTHIHLHTYTKKNIH